MKLRGTFDILGFETRMYFGIFRRFNSWKTGITNRCKNGEFVLFLDYDEVPLEWVLDELKWLQSEEYLGDIHIFKTAKGYHAVNTEKRSFTEILRLMNLTSADPHFINVPLKYGKKVWTLRTSDKKNKPKTSFVMTMKGSIPIKQSSPHNWLLRNLYGIKISKKYEDGEKHFYKSKYPIAE